MDVDKNLAGNRPSALRAFVLISLVIVLLAVALRAHHLGRRSLWLDEAIAANISRGTLSQTITLTRDLHSAPIVDPLLIYAVERNGKSPLAVRMPAFVASVLAVVLVLFFVAIPSIDYQTAGLSALMLAVSGAQIRYAQEVREYSLSVLYAAVLLYLFLSYVSRTDRGRTLIALCIALFFAPLIQYGLVLFGFGILSAMLILAFTNGQFWSRFVQVVLASAALALGSVLSFFLTLRYQWGDDAWYLKDFFWTRGSNLVHFIVYNSHHLIGFLLPGLVASLISTIAIVILVIAAIRARTLPPLLVVAFTSCGVVLACSILHLYPYGGIRQCLFLTPVLCLLASFSLIQLVNRLAGSAQSLALIAIGCLVLLSGLMQIRKMKPYAEVEDIQKVLSTLQGSMQPGDDVYVYPGAVFAVDFYVRPRDPHFIYANYHQLAPDRYVPELLAGLDPGTRRVWIVFSHIYRDEDLRILEDLRQDWDVEPVLTVTGSALYLAKARSVKNEVAAGTAPNEAYQMRLAENAHDSFWEWNVHNSRQTAP